MVLSYSHKRLDLPKPSNVKFSHLYGDWRSQLFGLNKVVVLVEDFAREILVKWIDLDAGAR